MMTAAHDNVVSCKQRMHTSHYSYDILYATYKFTHFRKMLLKILCEIIQ